MRQRVSTLAFLVPASIMARWLRATHASPDSTSWDRFWRSRSSRIIRPVILQLYGIMKSPLSRTVDVESPSKGLFFLRIQRGGGKTFFAVSAFADRHETGLCYTPFWLKLSPYRQEKRRKNS